MRKKIQTPLDDQQIEALRAGDLVYLSGIIYTARDAAHERLVQLLKSGQPLPFDPAGQVIYYVGPTPAKPGQIIGSAGPTSAYRMDAYTPPLLQLGLKGMIGKGRRNAAVKKSIQQNNALYFGAVGGLAALLAKSIKKAEVIAFADLGTEAIRRLEVENMPLTVIIDSRGNDLYQLGPEAYLKSRQRAEQIPTSQEHDLSIDGRQKAEI